MEKVAKERTINRHRTLKAEINLCEGSWRTAPWWPNRMTKFDGFAGEQMNVDWTNSAIPLKTANSVQTIRRDIDLLEGTLDRTFTAVNRWMGGGGEGSGRLAITTGTVGHVKMQRTHKLLGQRERINHQIKPLCISY